MATIQASYRHRSGTDANRQAATIHARELTVTSDRREVWMGTELVNGKGYDAIAPDPAESGYAVATTLAWPVRYRNHFARVAPVEWTGTYTHAVVLPNSGGSPARDGDEANIFVALPATTFAITLSFRNATAGGTQLAELVSGAEAAKWKLSFAVTGGAWELVGAAKLDLD